MDVKVRMSDKGHVMIPLRKNERLNDVYLELKTDKWLTDKKLWKNKCWKLHLQFGHGSYQKLKGVIDKAYCEKKELEKERKQFLETLKEICEGCSTCGKYKRNPAKPIVGFPLAEKFNEVVAIDLGENEDGKFMVMTDWATRYSQAEWVRNKTPGEMIVTLMNKWLAIFGPPSKLIADNGKEFQNEEFLEFTDMFGIEMLTTAAESPWSNGKCERMVGLLKNCMRKMKEEGITDRRHS